VLNVGRKARTIPVALRRALEARDRWCQFPGCTARRCDGHHIRQWAHGGPTRLDNLVGSAVGIIEPCMKGDSRSRGTPMGR
jgi:hypothetical protein